MVMNEKDLGLFDDPTYDDLARWVEEFVDGQYDKSAEEVADAIQLAFNEGRIDKPAYTELMDAMTPYIEGTAE